MTSSKDPSCPIAPPIAPSSRTFTRPQLASVRPLRESTNTALAVFLEQSREDRQ